jgi:S1-C subfamily serine protease
MDTAASAAGGGFYYQNATSDAYAIPIAKALKVVKAIEAGPASATVHIGATGFLGVQVASPGDGYGYGYGYGGTQAGGAIVAGVVAGSPADRAGLAYGEQITAIDGHAVRSPKAVVSLLLRKHPGDRVTLTWVDLYGARQTSSVTLASGPPQ